LGLGTLPARGRGNKIDVRPNSKEQPVLPTKLRYEQAARTWPPSGRSRRAILNSGYCQGSACSYFIVFSVHSFVYLSSSGASASHRQGS
jgi:hypothetical protein